MTPLDALALLVEEARAAQHFRTPAEQKAMYAAIEELAALVRDALRG